MGAIFDENFDYVWHTLRRLGIRYVDLEDLAQEVFLRVHAKLADYDPTRPMRAWLFGFAYRVAADHRRLARHRFEVGGPVAEPVDPSHLVDERLEVEEERALLLAALDSMELGERAILVMHDIDDIPVPEIAKELGVPVNTAYSRLRLAREELMITVKRMRNRRGVR